MHCEQASKHLLATANARTIAARRIRPYPTLRFNYAIFMFYKFYVWKIAQEIVCFIRTLIVRRLSQRVVTQDEV